MAELDRQAGNSRGKTYPLDVVIPALPDHSRLSTSVRLVLAVPAVVFSFFVNIGAMAATWAAAVVTGRVPQPLFDFQVFVLRWHLRAYSYALLLTDTYPVFEGAHPVECDLKFPDGVSRWKVAVWKTITLIPHAVALFLISAVAVPVSVFSWFVVVLTGRLPEPCRRFLSGLIAWYSRAGVYLQSLTDVFPPYSLRLRPRPARTSTYVLSAAVGLIPVGLMTTFAVFIIGFSGQHLIVEVPYETTSSGQTHVAAAVVESGPMTLEAIEDPADGSFELFPPDPGVRYVAFTIAIENWRGAGESVPLQSGSFYLVDATGVRHAPVVIGVGNDPGPGVIESGASGRATVVFAVPLAVDPDRLVWDVLDYIAIPRRGETIEWVFL